jgi:hypothetical protein
VGDYAHFCVTSRRSRGRRGSPADALDRAHSLTMPFSASLRTP